MKLEKAIEILELTTADFRADNSPYVRDAIKLGSEALKEIKEGRTRPGGMFFHDLPGETEE